MKVGKAIEVLQKLDPNAELMISAPFNCAAEPIAASSSTLDIPVRSIRIGRFYGPPGPLGNWVMLVGTSVWELDEGIEGL